MNNYFYRYLYINVMQNYISVVYKYIIIKHRIKLKFAITIYSFYINGYLYRNIFK